MGKFLFAILAAVASFALVESLICNRCSFNVLGVCVNPTNETCAFNTSVCYTGRSKFPALSSFAGFNIQGCKDNNTNCGDLSQSTLLGVTYETNTTCCSTDRCNTIVVNGAPSTRMTFTAAIGGAVLATVLGSVL